MRLYFRCPQSQKLFATDKYALQRDYRVQVDENGERRLQGSVVLDAGCPFCGLKHEYDVAEIGCPLQEGRDEQ